MILGRCQHATAIAVAKPQHRIPASTAAAGNTCSSLARPARLISFPPLLSLRPRRPNLPMSSTPSLSPLVKRDEEPTREEKRESGAPSSDPPPPAAAPLPPPPEVPLPGDCCGSGCVRCVWDIYYDELETYNKLIAERRTGTKKPED